MAAYVSIIIRLQMEVQYMAYGKISDKQKEILEFMKQDLGRRSYARIFTWSAW